MKSAKLFIIILSIIILNNCSHHEVKIDAVASPNQIVDYKGVVTSEMKNVVSLAYYDNYKKMFNNRTMFLLIVENYGDKPIAISNNNISVMFEGDSVDWSSNKIELETVSAVMKNTQRQIMTQNNMGQRLASSQGFGDVLTGSPRASSASIARENAFAANFSSVEAEARASGGQVRIIGNVPSGSNQSYSREMTQMRKDKMDTMKAQSYYAIPRMMIRPQVIMPNESMSGIFVCDTSKMKSSVKGNFIISVRIDDEEHKFVFSRS